MKASRLSFLLSVLCTAALTIGLCFCIITSFIVPADTLRLALACVCIALLCSALLLLPKSWIWLLGTVLLLAGGIYYLKDAVWESFSTLLYAISTQYVDAFPGLQVLSLTAAPADGDAALILLLLSIPYALLCSWTVLRGESLVYLLGAVLLPLALCLVILQTPPAAWAILLVVGVLALLLLSQLLRLRQTREGNRLALLLAVPLALLIGLLALVFPSEGYERADWSNKLQETLATAADKLTLFRRDAQTGQVRFTSPINPSTLGSYLWDSSVSNVNLNRVGPMRQYGRAVMRVQSENGGRCHLRGDSLAVYEDNHWKALPESDYPDTGGMMNALLAGVVPVSYHPDMQIETNMKSGIYYLPYFTAELPEDAVPYYDAYVKNPSQQTSYSISYFAMRGGSQNEPYEAFVHETYTQVPDETRQVLADLLPQLGAQPGDDVHEIAMAVNDYVSAIARYDLDTPSVPSGEDFVSWFLHDSGTGYCVHFASAAAILLRCMDVPARYVTGYYTTVSAGEWTEVTSDDAHAWVEYYVDGVGWYVLDPTPAAEEAPAAADATPDQNTETNPEPDQVPAPQPDEPVSSADLPETAPEAPAPSAEPQAKSFHLLRYIWPVLAAAAVLLLWRALLFSLRRSAIGRGSSNRRAVTLYHHVCWLAKKTGTEVPTEFLAIAEKARFSHHKLSREDLAPMQQHADELTAQLLADKRFWKQLLYRVIYALG